VQSIYLQDYKDMIETQRQTMFQGGNLYCHLSLWRPEDFDEMGYTVVYDPTYHARNTLIDGIEGAMICYKNFY
jgi:hypothetical protein